MRVGKRCLQVGTPEVGARPGTVSNPDHDSSLRHPLVPQLVGVASLVSLGVTFVCLKIPQIPQIQKAPQKVTIFEATETAIETPVEKERRERE